jgi:hypothetical protein
MFRYVDYQVTTEYLTPQTYNIVVRRIDMNCGWEDNLRVLVYNRKTKDCEIVAIPNCRGDGVNEVTVNMTVPTAFLIEPCFDRPFVRLPVLVLPPIPPEIRVEKSRFNQLFPDAKLGVLPSSLFAVGLTGDTGDGKFYVYNTDYQQFKNIREPIYHIIRVALKYGFNNFYFIVSSTDGYMESTYISHTRGIFKEMNEMDEMDPDQYLYIPSSPEEIPVFHGKITILAQSVHHGLPFVGEIIDRHYFYHNLYHSFRSFHQGVPFREKQGKVVFGGQSRDTVFNWDAHRNDPEKKRLPPRQYFREYVAPKYGKFVVCPDGWIDRKDMALNYKYILNVDGMASCYDATAWLLNSGSVIFKPRSVWKQWFYGEFIAGIHYVELKENFSDIEEKWQWCETHPDECEIMVNRCKDLFQKTYCYSNVVQYTKTLIENTIIGRL